MCKNSVWPQKHSLSPDSLHHQTMFEVWKNPSAEDEALEHASKVNQTKLPSDLATDPSLNRFSRLLCFQHTHTHAQMMEMGYFYDTIQLSTQFQQNKSQVNIFNTITASTWITVWNLKSHTTWVMCFGRIMEHNAHSSGLKCLVTSRSFNLYDADLAP